MDIRKQTVLIVRRGNEFLVGKIVGMKKLRWSIYPGDAWQTRSREDAKVVADLVRGDIMLFNPVAGQIREAVLNG